jgi:poly(3-hydroxybutyrate) depolymerase
MSTQNSFFRGRLPMLAALFFGWTLTGSPTAAAAGPMITIAPGAGSFTFVDKHGDPSKPITVYTYLPKGLPPGAARIVFVMHGHGKNAQGYRDTWVEHAEKYRFMVVAPRFDEKQWGGGDYSYASVIPKGTTLQASSMWSFNVVEHLFDAIKDATGNQRPDYFIYGHSEGGQFVHRLVLFLPEARYAKAVAANPGWYTMPTFDVKFPYGLDGSPVTEASLKKSLGRELVLMLGDRDTDPGHKDLRKTPEAMAQGANRFERGRKFVREAHTRATELKCPFAWQIQVVPGAAHQNSKMSGPAAAVLMGR